MALQTTDAPEFRFARSCERPACPECGERLLAPEASEFLAEGRIRHSWTCEACGASFRTAVKLGR
jgi:RNase P subunit RPR2